MEYTSAEGEKAKKRYDNAIALVASGDYIKAFEIFDDVISVFPEEHRNSFHIRVQQANIFLLLVDKALSKDVEITYFLGAIGCVSEDVRVTLLRTRLLRTLGMALDSVFYFKKCIRSGKQGLAAAEAKNKTEIERLIKEAELMIDESKTSPTIAHYWPKFSDSEDSQEPRCEDRVGDELRSYWMGLDVKIKRDFMKVSVEKLRSFVKGVHTKVGVDVLKNVLDVAREHKKWRVWVCRTKCDKVCSSAEECRTHLEQKHAAVFKPSSEEDVVMRIGVNWAKKIQVGPWEPVRTVAAVEMIKAELEYVKGFTSTSRKKGWSSEWPVAADEERSGLLMEIKLLLVSLCNHQILSCSIRDWVMSFPVKHLRKLGVSEESINDCRLVESPQSICFLGRDELKQIRGFLKKINKPSVDLQPGGISQSAKTMEEDSMETKDTLGSEKGPLETSSNNDIQEEATKVDRDDMQNMPGEDSVSGNLESALGGAATRYNSALDMTLKALVNVNVLKEQVVKYNKQPVPDNLGEQVLCALQSLFTSVVSEEIKTEGAYTLILRDLLVSLEEVDSMSSGAAEVLVPILEYWHCWKNSERDSLVDRLFTLEENERMSCRKCGRSPNYPEQSSYGIVVASDSIRNVKCAFGDIKFVDILKVTRMEYKMLCDIKTGGCGTTNFVHHVISRCPPIFIIVLEWEKGETEEEISETTKALEWEIDISRLYEGLEPNTNYRLVSMVGYGDEDEEHICMAYEKNQWVNLRRESLAGEVVGNNWKNVVTFCGERKVRPVILLYEAV
ncbi:hypothetical protein BRARA_B03780 [Brassica rapa]|uniref:Uncharacterized protein n=1 Tax=Brassica campestris TaxID=3711 RepID=A0A398AMN3_BRACM|nr:hypothetical protein BRARA_B03780 [Brassica rapa]